MERHWLEWNMPMLPAAATWVARLGRRDDGALDLEHVVCVTPGRRAGRDLRGLLAQHARGEGLALVPPRTITPGLLAETCLDLPAPCAARLERQLAWVTALRALAPPVRAALLPQRLPEQLVDWFQLAGAVDAIWDELAGAQLQVATVRERAEALELFGEGDRWQAIEDAATHYRRTLASNGLVDPGDAVLDALGRRAWRHQGAIVLVGVSGLNPRQRSILTEGPCPITALVHAPPDEAHHFDDFGCVAIDAWAERRIDLPDDRIVVAGDPTDQGQAAMRDLARLDGALAADDITVGVGDPSLTGIVSVAASWAGIDVHDAAGVELRTTGPWRLLAAVADFLEDPRFETLATLVRHPHAEHRLLRRGAGHQSRDQSREESGEEPERDPGAGAPPAGRPAPDPLTGLDEHFTRHLQEQPDGGWVGRHAMSVRGAWDAALHLLAPLRVDAPDEQRPLGAWANAVLDVLADVYAARPAQSDDPKTQQTIEAGLALHDLIDAFGALPATLAPATSAADALRVMLAETATETIAPHARAGQVEMLGWLELHLDPALALVLVGANDGSIPQTVGGDPLLPEALRRELGLLDNRGRYARDAYLLTAMSRSRDHFTIIGGRTDAHGDPLAPSRLLLACDDDQLPARVHLLCGDQAAPGPAVPLGAPASAPRSAFTVPALPALAAPDTMAVTDFRHYLTCPYRYALGRRLRLEPRADAATELDGLQFGSLAHDVLEAFGTDEDARATEDAEDIEAFLLRALRTLAHDQFGRSPAPTVRIQLMRLADRFERFARVQAALRQEGWEIAHSEVAFRPDTTLDVPDGDPMRIRGVIDRVDYHRERRTWRIIDYKTGDGGASPFMTHHGHERPPGPEPRWRDLQLPLYKHLAEQQGLRGPCETAYIVLPKRPEGTALRVASWSPTHIESAVACAQDVVRGIRDGHYPMAHDVSPRFDPFARICHSVTLGAPPDDAVESGATT